MSVILYCIPTLLSIIKALVACQSLLSVVRYRNSHSSIPKPPSTNNSDPCWWDSRIRKEKGRQRYRRMWNDPSGLILRGSYKQEAMVVWEEGKIHSCGEHFQETVNLTLGLITSVRPLALRVCKSVRPCVHAIKGQVSAPLNKHS